MLAYKQNSGYAQIYKEFYNTKPKNVLPYDPWTGTPLISEPQRREYPEDPLETMRAQGAMTRVYPSSSYMPYIPLTGRYEPAGNADSAPFQRAELQLRNSSTYAQTPLLNEIGADHQAENGSAHADPEPLDKEQRAAVDLYTDGVRRSLSYFGEPSGVVTSQDVHNYEARWRPFLHSAHWTWAYLRRYTNQYHYELEKAAERKPPVFLAMRGWFDHLF